MILRRLTKHIKDQNWFAVGLDFFIVVAGILLAFQITNWSEQQQEKAAFARAEIALVGDLVDNYINAKERIALAECRKLDLRNLGEQLLQNEDSWEAVANPHPDADLHAFYMVVRSPKRYWKDRIWETELARGSFDLMQEDRRQQFDNIFVAARNMGRFQDDLVDKESRLKILGQAKQLSRAERFELFLVVSEIDEHNLTLEQIGQNIVEEIENLNLKLSDETLKSLRELIVIRNDAAKFVYGDCQVPITSPFLDDLHTQGKL